MTSLLQQAFERASELPQEGQEKFARFFLAELEAEREWAELFSRPESEDLLERLADEAVAAHRGRTTKRIRQSPQANLECHRQPTHLTY